MNDLSRERVQACLVSAAHRSGTAACLLLIAAVAAEELRLDKRYVLAMAFTAAQLGCVCGYVGAVSFRAWVQEPTAARESRNVTIFNLVIFMAALAWMALPRVLPWHH
jgi:Mg/Co/Ni transporter MgtE